MDIEQKAVAKVVDAISSSDYLAPQITSGDKGVSWDGYINVYKKKGEVHEKETLYKSIRVQVKGKITSDVRATSLKYKVHIADLRNFLTEGGTIFFVVCINNDKNEHQIYFKSFLPSDIKPILKKYGKQKSRTVKFAPFPTDKYAMSELLINVAANMKKQMPFINEEITILDDLKQDGTPVNVHVCYADILNREGLTTSVFFDYDQYIYAKNDKGIDIPVGNKKFDYRDKKVNIPVYVKDVKFYDDFILRKTKSETIYRFAKSISFKTKANDKLQAEFEFNFFGNLNQRLRDVEFVYNFLHEGSLIIGEDVIVDSLENIKDEKYDKYRLLRHLCWLRNVKQMLNEVSFKGEFEYDNISSEDAKWLRILVDCFVFNKSVKLHSDGIGLTSIQIAGHNLKFFVNRLSAEKEEYSIARLDAFKGKIERKSRDGSLYQISLYSLLTKEDLLTCTNIDYDALLKQTKQVPLSEAFAWELNRLLLDIISAWDETGDTHTDLSDAAYNLAEWIRNEVDLIPKEISTLNLYQIVKRKRALNDAEYAELSQLLDVSNLTPDCRMAAHLLLDEHHSARRCFCKLSTEHQETYKRMPIFRFWKEEV